MTVDQLFRKLQKLKMDGHGEDEVLICDMTEEPPVPEVLDQVNAYGQMRKVFLFSETAQQVVTRINKLKQSQANGSNC